MIDFFIASSQLEKVLQFNERLKPSDTSAVKLYCFKLSSQPESIDFMITEHHMSFSTSVIWIDTGHSHGTAIRANEIVDLSLLRKRRLFVLTGDGDHAPSYAGNHEFNASRQDF